MADAAGWDRRYATPGYVWKTDPNCFLPGEVGSLVPGSAVDLACGEGRNAIWLATQGWRVTGVDFSVVGLDKGRSLAADRGVEVDWVAADVTTWSTPRTVDLVIVFYLHLPAAGRRSALGTAARAVAPGGTLLVVGHDLANLSDGYGGPQDPSVLYTPDDVVADVMAAGVEGFVVERADRVARAVDHEGGRATAIDCLVRVRRGNEEFIEP